MVHVDMQSQQEGSPSSLSLSCGEVKSLCSVSSVFEVLTGVSSTCNPHLSVCFFARKREHKPFRVLRSLCFLFTSDIVTWTVDFPRC